MNVNISNVEGYISDISAQSKKVGFFSEDFQKYYEETLQLAQNTAQFLNEKLEHNKSEEEKLTSEIDTIRIKQQELLLKIQFSDNENTKNALMELYTEYDEAARTLSDRIVLLEMDRTKYYAHYDFLKYYNQVFESAQSLLSDINHFEEETNDSFSILCQKLCVFVERLRESV